MLTQRNYQEIARAELLCSLISICMSSFMTTSPENPPPAPVHHSRMRSIKNCSNLDGQLGTFVSNLK
ncbi:hypothetical protein DNTS_020358 [Danionella cerebrum]|uniref:Uncharacterized protein n=1 Tax=Danionella cerebrum TaxID=2873325 RepID=A0A553Q6U1_9TELE|nr:hypothetical protein DNTS_020358 [Danionella translucida]